MLLRTVGIVMAISLFTLLDGTSALSCERNNTRTLPTFIIDLDKPAIDRFKEMATYFKTPITLLITQFKKTLGYPYLMPFLEFLASRVDNYVVEPFRDEMKGVAEVLGISLGDIVVLNLFYEFSAYCTSIVAEMESGQLIHGRNLDNVLPEYLQNVTFVASYHRNNELVFTSVQFAGFLGIHTGHKLNSFTFSINERDKGAWWINLIFALLVPNAKPLFVLSREVMESATSYDQAVEQLSASGLIAPLYFIVGGVEDKQGCVITRNQLGVVDTWHLNDTRDASRWYLLETNYDHWVAPPADDDRRTPGMRAMNQTTQANIDFSTLLDVLSMNPVCNGETVFSAVMTAKQSVEDGGLKFIVH